MPHKPGDQTTEALFRRRTRVAHRAGLGLFGSVLGTVRDLHDRPLVVVQWEHGITSASKPASLERLSDEVGPR
ncbi:hypothetical protein [Kribbella sp. NPDC051718]|uniref:hypothetical protein n=1 Tax=Kribbella sp. NPDC051718 TaxID=3155168 RepID=UPI00344551BB